MSTQSVVETKAGESKFDLALKDPALDRMTPDRAEFLLNFQGEMQKSLEERAKIAEYKIEVIFGKNRTLNGFPNGNVAVISFYESGKRLHGGGDSSCFICDRRDFGAKAQAAFNPSTLKKRSGGIDGCGKLIPSRLLETKIENGIGKNIVMCPHCQRVWNADNLTAQVYGRWTTRKLAGILTKFWHGTNGNADLYLKFHYKDIRYLVMEKQWGTETARRLRGAAIYPLQNIIKDTSAGAALEDRINAFLQA